MGRLVKKGLDYFNIDCNQEDNLTLVEAKHGISGYGIVVKLWKKCYQIQGYYAQWDEKNMLLFAREIAVDPSFLMAVIETCFDELIFSRRLYQEYRILTSSGVQKRWKTIVTDAKRKDVTIDPIFNLLPFLENQSLFTPEEMPINSGIPGINPGETLLPPEESTQSKVKESKEDKNTPENTGPPPAAPSAPPTKKRKKTRENFVPPSSDELQAYFLKLMGKKWTDARCRNTADGCMDHYVANGWIQAKGKPIVDWYAAARQWIRRDLNGDFARQPAGKPSPPPAPIPPPTLSKTQEELNYFYGRWLEDPASVTVISLDPLHYNALKTAGLVGYLPDQVEQIRQQAKEHMTTHALDPGAEVPLMKKFGVLEFFKQLKVNGKATVFEVERASEKV